MPTEQEVLEYLEEHGIPKDYRDNLRDQFETFKKEATDWKSKADLYDQDQRRPLIEKALKENASVDVTKVAPKVLKAIQNELGDAEPTAEWATETAQEYGLPTTQTQTPSQSQSDAQQMVEQVSGSASLGSGEHDWHQDLKRAYEEGDQAKAEAILAAHGQLATS